MNKTITLTLSLFAGLIFTVAQLGAAEIAAPSSRLGPSAGKLGQPTGVVFSCPNKLHGVNLSIDAQYSAPSGWAAKSFPTGYSGQTLVVSMHQVMSGKMHCSYGKSSLATSLRLTTISRNVPAGKTCTAQSGYKFQCQ